MQEMRQPYAYTPKIHTRIHVHTYIHTYVHTYKQIWVFFCGFVRSNPTAAYAASVCAAMFVYVCRHVCMFGKVRICAFDHDGIQPGCMYQCLCMCVDMPVCMYVYAISCVCLFMIACSLDICSYVCACFYICMCVCV